MAVHAACFGLHGHCCHEGADKRVMKKIFIILFILILVIAPKRNAEAALPTFDAVNAALQELQNSILNSEFARQIAVTLETLEELRNQYLEMIRFHSGFDEIVDSVIGDPLKKLESFGRSLFDAEKTGEISIQFFNESKTPEDIKSALEEIAGEIPEGNQRPYIPFEEFQVVDGFNLAKKIREEGEATRQGARLIGEAAQSASPKGAVRLTAHAMGALIAVSQQNQEALAKIIELQATQVEQKTREEKLLEKKRIEYSNDAKSYLEGILGT